MVGSDFKLDFRKAITNHFHRSICGNSVLTKVNDWSGRENGFDLSELFIQTRLAVSRIGSMVRGDLLVPI